MISTEVAESIDQSVLCWLATISDDGFPNVSPKEAFLHDGAGKILVANIASPVTVRNIKHNSSVCISFVNVFIQKGFKIQGNARLFARGDAAYEERLSKLTEGICGTFPIISVIEITPTKVDSIIAPSYRLHPESGPRDRIQDALKTYQVVDYQEQVKQWEKKH